MDRVQSVRLGDVIKKKHNLGFFVKSAPKYFTNWNIILTVLILCFPPLGIYVNVLFTNILTLFTSFGISYITPQYYQLFHSKDQNMRIVISDKQDVFNIFTLLHVLPFIAVMYMYVRDHLHITDSNLGISILIVIIYFVSMNPVNVYNIDPHALVLLLALSFVFYFIIVA